MADALLDSPLVYTLGWTLLHFIWQGALIGAATALALRVMRHATPASRYLVACAGLLLLAVAPIVSFASGAPVDIGVRTEAGRQAVPTLPLVPPVAIDPLAAVPEAVRVEHLLWAAVLLWIAGVVLLSARLLAGAVGVARLTRATLPVDGRVTLRAGELAGRLGITRAVRVVESTAARVPTVIGWLRPVVLLPASALTGMPAAHLDAVIAHELAHVRRHDYLVNAIQAIVETLLFYHPVVWWCSRRIRIERELCCDDLAVEVCGDRIMYARALARLEELRARPATLPLSAAGGSLVDRIRRVLAGTRADHGRPAWSLVALLLIAIVSIAVLPRAGLTDATVSAQSSRRDVPLPPAPPDAPDLPGPPDVRRPIAAAPAAPAPPTVPEPLPFTGPGDIEWSVLPSRIDAALDALWREAERALQDAPLPSAPPIDDIDVAELQRRIEASLEQLARETGGIFVDLPQSPAPAQPAPAAPPRAPAPPAAALPALPALPAVPAPPSSPVPPAQAPGDTQPTDAQIDAVRKLADDLARTTQLLQRQAAELRRAEQQMQLRRMELMAAERAVATVREQTAAQEAAIEAMRDALREAYARSEAFRAIEPDAERLREQVEALRKQIEAIRTR